MVESLQNNYEYSQFLLAMLLWQLLIGNPKNNHENTKKP